MIQMVKAIFGLLALTLVGGYLFYVLIHYLPWLLYFLVFCFTGGLILYVLLDLKPWRKDSQLWFYLKTIKKK